ncbi:Telomerase Cajal body protein 1 [Strongyloides ratti]|uniref:WD repeat-containing protein 79 n=1 Tax=Strongyloides ratti TaxID=34506 RepID=A0A090LF11_STRRB|nr:Telomerase Cajal body protein 1 [Strongyloides ratti]CEF66703.1 Telomerase Cajal body protein 1 [Strongyloides ratti]
MATQQAGIGSLLSLIKGTKKSSENNISHVVKKETKVTENISIKLPDVNYDFSNEPTLIELEKDCFMDKAKLKRPSVKFDNNYIRTVKFNKNGNYLISSSQDRILRLFFFDKNSNPKIRLVREKECAGFIYDACWSKTNDVFAFTSFQSPIHLYDTNGECINTFKGINNLDEMDTAKCVCFTNDSNNVIAGYKDKIRIFDMEKSGKQIYDINTYKKFNGGQKGNFTCLRVNPINDNLFIGSTTGDVIGVYSLSDNSCQMLISHEFDGITWMEYSKDGQYIFIGGRKDEGISCYDTRMLGIKLYDIPRPGVHNQRIEFEIDPSGSFLFSGTTLGSLRITDLRSGPSFQNTKEFNILSTSIPSLSLHPEENFVALGHGQRIFPSSIFIDEDDNNEVTENIPINNGISIYKF